MKLPSSSFPPRAASAIQGMVSGNAPWCEAQEGTEEVGKEASSLVTALAERARDPELVEKGGEGEGEGEGVGFVEREGVRSLLARWVGDEEGRKVLEG